MEKEGAYIYSRTKEVTALVEPSTLHQKDGLLGQEAAANVF